MEFKYDRIDDVEEAALGDRDAIVLVNFVPAGGESYLELRVGGHG
jgi:hypothetical protein